MPENASLIDYYARRAREYERIYDKPERQADLEIVRNHLRELLAGRDVLEVVCGTGYWTHVAARAARSIVATDINEEVLAIARSKEYPAGGVSFQKCDAFQLGGLPPGNFTAGLAVHWWSHLRKAEVRQFLQQFHRVLTPGALVVFMDNRFVPGSSTPISRTDAEGNTYQTRRLENGDAYEVLKNFPGESETRTLLADLAAEVHWTDLQYFWLLTYRTKP
jgi:SAM-dependent methyltransferase